MTFRLRGLLAFLLLLASADFARAQTLQGNLDSANSTNCTIAGWARDPQTVDPIQVRVYRDGNATTGVLVTTFVASLLRNDLPYTDKNHGFNQPLGSFASVADGRDHTIFVYALSGSGVSTNISGSGRVIRCTIAVVALAPPKTILVAGETMQLDPVALDFQGNARNGDRFDFTASNTNISLSATGLVTAKMPGVATVRANVQGTGFSSPTVVLQVVPSRIDVEGGGSDMRVGESRQFTATALDINSAPIPGLTFAWRVTGANGTQINAATIDSTTGNLTANGISLLTVHAQIIYSGQTVDQLYVFEGTTTVSVKAGSEFKLTRLVTNAPMDRGLQLRPAYNSEPAFNDLGQIAFTANLEGLGNALMLYDNGRFDLLASAGTPAPLGGFIWHFEAPPAINNRGDVLVRVVTTSGWGLLRASKTSGLTFFLENGAAEGFARMSGLAPSKGSLNDRGDMVFHGNYMPIGATTFTAGLFFLNDTTFSVVWSAADPLPGFPMPYTFDQGNYGVDRDGVVYFRVVSGSESAIYRADGMSLPVKIAGTGAGVGGFQIASVNTMAVSPNGSIAFHVTGNVGQVGLARLRSGQSALEYLRHSSMGQVLSINDNGETLYVGDPGTAPFWGLYTWASGTAPPSQVVRFGNPVTGSAPNTLEGGELPNWAKYGKITATRGIFASLDSVENHQLVTRLDGSLRTLFKAGAVVNTAASLNFLGLLPGAMVGPAHTYGGGGNASILETGAFGVRSVWIPGDPSANGIASYNFTHATKNPAGDVYLNFGDGLVRLNGVSSTLYRWPVEDRDRVMVRGPSGWYDGSNALAVNSQGTIVFYARTDTDFRLELSSQGGLMPIAVFGGSNPTASPGGGKFSAISGTSGRQNTVLIDERGRVMTNATVTGGPAGLFIYENGQWKSAALYGVTTINGVLVRGASVMRVAGDTFYALFDMANIFPLIAKYDGQNWIPLIKRGDVLPDGTTINSFQNFFAANRRGDIAYTPSANSRKIVLRTADGVNHLVYAEMSLTDDGDRLPDQAFELDIRDNGDIYFSAIDSRDRSLIYKASTLLGATQIPFSFPGRGGTSVLTSGTPPSVTVGYATIQGGAPIPTPAGLAIFGYSQNNVLVTEAGVSASAAIRTGRTYAEVSSTVNTGLAIVNPNSTDASVAFYFTDLNGINFGSGTTTIPARGKITAFLNQAPFNGGASLRGSFTFTSSVPIAVVALRGLNNERGEFLITTLPVTDIGVPAASNTVVFPDFADGGGWSTQVILVNPGDTTLTGSVQFRDGAGAVTTVMVNGQSDSSFSYSIPPRSSFKLQTAGSAASAVSGSVRINPFSNTPAPSGLAVFSLRTAGVTVTEVGVIAQSDGTAFRLYAETAGSFGEAGSIQSGLAVTNNTASAADVTLELTNLDGTSTGLTSTLSVPANGQIATFLNQIQGFATLKAPFKGVLRVSSAAKIAVVGLRARYNERRDFLASSTPPVNESSAPSSAPLYFPQIADGGGYTTQFIVFSNQTGQSSGALEVFSESGGVLSLSLR